MGMLKPGLSASVKNRSINNVENLKNLTAGGRYSLNIRDIELSGRGDFAIAFEKLKETKSSRVME